MKSCLSYSIITYLIHVAMMIHDINPNLAIIDGYITIVGVVYDDGWS
jgi:hypothetical protein